jgi:hypothetical protein
MIKLSPEDAQAAKGGKPGIALVSVKSLIGLVFAVPKTAGKKQKMQNPKTASRITFVFFIFLLLPLFFSHLIIQNFYLVQLFFF